MTAAHPGVELSIVVPAYNEASVIARSLERITTFLQRWTPNYEVIVGDDGSSDRTAEVARSMALPRVRVLVLPRRGKGGTLTRCLAEASGTYVGFVDADLEIDVAYLGDLYGQVRAGYDVAIASKSALPEFARERPVLRRITTVAYNGLVRGLFRSKVRDHQGGMKLFRADALRPVLTNLRNEGWLWDTEVIVRLVARNARIVEVPVRTQPTTRPSRVSTISTSLSMLRDLVSFYLSWRVERAALTLDGTTTKTGAP